MFKVQNKQKNRAKISRSGTDSGAGNSRGFDTDAE